LEFVTKAIGAGMEPTAFKNGNPQVEDGYTRIANELWEAWMRCPFSPREERVLKTILRFSYGVGRRHALLSKSEIAFYTAMDLAHVGRTLKSLCSKKVIDMENTTMPGLAQIAINKHYLDWEAPRVLKAPEGFERHLSQTLTRNLTSFEVANMASRGCQDGNHQVAKPASEVATAASEVAKMATQGCQDGNPQVAKPASSGCQNGNLVVSQPVGIYDENPSLKKVKEIYKENIKENKEREKKREKVREGETPPPSCRTLNNFNIPSLQQVTAYCEERKNTINPQTFIDYYTSNGWMVGRTRMKDGKAAVRTWEQRRRDGRANSPAALTGSETYRDEDGCLRDAGGYPIDIEIHE